MQNEIYVRTERGTTALNDPLAKLDPWLKHALRLMDGRRDVAAINRSCPAGSGEKLIATLAELGLAQKSGPIEPDLAMTLPMPIVTELPPQPAVAKPQAEVAVGLRSLSRTPTKTSTGGATGAFRPLSGERLNEIKSTIAKALVDNAGTRSHEIALDLARKMTAAATASDLAALVPEAEAYLTRHSGEPALAAFRAVTKESGVTG
jgi:hypothetical protein